MCSASFKTCYDVPVLIRLWYHENMRVFHDRLTTEGDRDYLKESLVDFFKIFHIEREDVITTERVIFADFIQGRVIIKRIPFG